MQYIIKQAYEHAKVHSPDYFKLSGCSVRLLKEWQPGGFSHASTAQDHFERHGKGVGAKDVRDYVKKAKMFLLKPLGDYGDVFIKKDGKIYKYDYGTNHFAVAYPEGHIGTYWNLGADKDPSKGDEYWERIKQSE